MQHLSLLSRDSLTIVANLQLNQFMYRLLIGSLASSTCPERRVSAAIQGFKHNECHLLSVGVNGDPVGLGTLPLHLHKRHCIHAEEMALRNLPPETPNYALVSYSSLAPCYDCATKLYDAGICAHVYIHDYDDPTGVDFLLDRGRPVYRLRFCRLTRVHPDIHLPPNWIYSKLWRNPG